MVRNAKDDLALKKIAELIADLYERDLALQVESEALGNAEAWKKYFMEEDSR